MTDITAELAALPKMPEVEHYCTPSLDKQADAGRYHYALADALRARLAIAERLLDTTMTELSPALYLAACEDARAYLAFRAKEQP